MSNDKLPTARGLISKIVPNKANFEHCGQNRVINGSLLIDIERAIEEHTSAHTAALRQEVEELRAWKESASAVMNEMDFQGLAKKLGIGLGESVSANIGPKIDELLAEADDLKSQLAKYRSLLSELTTVLHRYSQVWGYDESKLVDKATEALKQ